MECGKTWFPHQQVSVRAVDPFAHSTAVLMHQRSRGEGNEGCGHCQPEEKEQLIGSDEQRQRYRLHGAHQKERGQAVSIPLTRTTGWSEKWMAKAKHSAAALGRRSSALEMAERRME